MKQVAYVTRMDPSTGRMTPPEGKRRIFISYRHADEEKLPLCKILTDHILEKLDVAVWYDRNLTAGEEYDREIQEAIACSDAFVLLLSPRILESSYVFSNEIPLARKYHVSVIPVIAGLAEEDIPGVEAYVGRVHIPTWFLGERDHAPVFPTESLTSFLNGLRLSLASKDLLDQARMFCERGSGNVSLRYLTPEQIFLKAYGYLFGVSDQGDKSVGIRLMESILAMYGGDPEFSDFQDQVGYELVKHLYRADQPELCVTYLRPLLEHQYGEAEEFLLKIYHDQWHPEILSGEPDLSMILFRKLFGRHFGYEWDGESALQKASDMSLPRGISPSCSHSVGALILGEHVARFVKSTNEERTVDLWVDDICVASYPLYASYGDVYTLYLAYDARNDLLISLHADFDHYGVETMTCCHMFRVKEEEITAYVLRSDWMRGLRALPYTPITFHIT